LIHCCPSWLETWLGAAENAGHNHPLQPSYKAGWPLEICYP
jgi:hypothetical protein